MTDETIRLIKLHQDREAARTRDCSFSDAVEQMVALAARHTSEPKLLSAAEVLGDLPGAAAPEWIQIDMHHGKRVRCTICGESYEVPAERFVGVVKGIASFVEAHGECGEDGA